MGDRTRDDVSTPDTKSPFDRGPRARGRDRENARRRTREGEAIHGDDREAPGPLPPPEHDLD